MEEKKGYIANGEIRFVALNKKGDNKRPDTAYVKFPGKEEDRIAKVVRLLLVQTKQLMSAFDRSNLVYQGKKLSDFGLLHTNAAFISDVLLSETSNRGLILHLTSKAFLLMATVLAAYSCLIGGQGSMADQIYNLKEGDLVIYENKRGQFWGIDQEGRAIIEQAGSLMNFVTPVAFYKIKPYHGNATTLDGRGLRKDFRNRQAFISSVFQIETREIPSEINESVVIVCNKQEAEQIVEGTEIESDNGKRIRLSDVFPSAYYTANEIIHFSGNAAKSNPILRFTSKVSVARELIIEDSQKKITGLIVSGNDVIDAGLSELSSLFSRRSLRSGILLSRIVEGDYSQLLSQYPDCKLCAWTKDAVESNLDHVPATFYSDESVKLSISLENLLINNVTHIILELVISNESYDEIKRNLYFIAHGDYSDNDTEFFVIHAYSLLNIFTYAFFPLKIVEEQVEMKTIGISSPAQQLTRLKEIAESFSGLIGDQMKVTVEILTEFYFELYLTNPKHNWLIEKLNLVEPNQKIAVVIPKVFFRTVFYPFISGKEWEKNNIDFVTPNRFDNENLYDEIIAPGVFLGKHFNIFNTTASPNINVIGYSFEEPAFRSLKKKTERLMNIYNERNFIKYDYHCLSEDEKHKIVDQTNGFEIDCKLEEYINNISIYNAISSLNGAAAEGIATSEIVKIATFESGETVFFTKNYCPYVFISETGTVEESEVELLAPGDVLVFATHSEQTRDIIEEILLRIINSVNCDEKLKEYYRKSKYWKQVLREFLTDNGFTIRDLATKMHDLGNRKHEVTLRNWLDEDSHVVGPRDSESFDTIALITNDPEMLADSNGFCQACREIRSMRIRILKYLGISIINSLGTLKVEEDDLIKTVAGDVSKLAITLQIEKVVDTHELSVPSYLANRPQNM